MSMKRIGAPCWAIYPWWRCVTSTRRRLCFFLDPHWQPIVLCDIL